MVIPQFLKKIGKEHEEHRHWVETLPSNVQKLRDEWTLEMKGSCFENATCSYVINCIVEGHQHAVLKLGLPHEEAQHEIEGLALLKGDPTVHLLQHNKALNAMLLEECIPGTQLRLEPESKQDEIITDLIKKIWKADHSNEKFQDLGFLVEKWNRETYEKLDNFPDPELAKKGCQIKEELIASTEEKVFLATDLHAGNVLKAERHPWLVIDIKPYVGDSSYDLTQHMLNCMSRFTFDPKALINRLANLSEVDAERLRLWMFVRLATENNGVHQDLAKQLI